MAWWSKKVEKVEAELKPGICQCGHSRCYHENGKGRCVVDVSADQEPPVEFGTWVCACKCYVPDDDDDDDDTPEIPTDPEVAELEKIHRL